MHTARSAKDIRPDTACPHLGTSCPQLPQCDLHGLRFAYCRAWFEEQQALGKARLVRERGIEKEIKDD